MDARKRGRAEAPGIWKIEMPCSSRVEAIHILKAIENGSDGVIVLACPERTCRMIEGSRRAEKRIAKAKKLLAEAGIEPERVALVRAEPPVAGKFERVIAEAKAAIKKLGPTPLK